MPEEQDKFEILISKLLLRTKEGRVDWRKTETEDTFQASFPSYAVRVWPELVNDGFGRSSGHCLALYDQDGDFIERTSEPEGQYGSALSDLHSAARRQAMGYDKALDTLIEALG